MKKLFLSISFVLLSTQAFGDNLLSPPSSYEPDRFESNEPIFIEKVDYNGSGCSKADTTSQLYDTNNDGFPDEYTLLYRKYIAEQGPDIDLSERRKNCEILVQFHLPQGFQFSLVDARYNGYADLPEGVMGQQESTYSFPLFTNQKVTFRSNIKGPKADNYDRTDTLGLASLVWSPCGASAPMNIQTQVSLVGRRLPADKYAAAMTLDKILGRVRQIYGFQWREC